MPEIAKNTEECSEKAAPNKDAIYEENLLGDMLPVYYKRLFPHKLFHRWLSYELSEPDIFQNREISFTMEGDIYIRSQCFENQNELEKWICTKVPQKIDIGAVMASRPRNFLTTPKAKEPVQRELVFDIDMTDYDDVRNCCSGTAICLLCWKFMAVAVRILDAALREDFGFEHILWVFSGRRGVHCWVCDFEARHLNIRERSSVAEYLQLVTHTQLAGGLTVPRVQLGERFHHSVKRALAVIEPVFEEIILEDQNLFGTPKGLQKLLFIIHDENARSDVETYLQNTHHDGTHSREIWHSFTRYVQAQRNSHASSVWGRKLKNIVEEIKLGVVYPRLDINVSKGFNHLLKAPFCIHPGTGKLCTPFSASSAAKFDPINVANIAQLLHEINAFDFKTKAKANDDIGNVDNKNDANDGNEAKCSRIKDYKKTSMFKGCLVFEEFLRKIETNLKHRSRAIAVSDAKMEF